MTQRILFASLLLIFLIGIWRCNPQKKSEDAFQQEINELPYLNYQTLDGTPATTRALPGKSIIVLFNTDCDHCQREATAISEKSEAFKEYNLLFVAADSVQNIEAFSKNYQLADKANVQFGQATYQDVFINFGSIPTPSIYIYSREKKLVKAFNGETPVEEIIKFL